MGKLHLLCDSLRQPYAMIKDQGSYLIESWEMLCDKHTIENAETESVRYGCQEHSQKSGNRQSVGRAT